MVPEASHCLSPVGMMSHIQKVVIFQSIRSESSFSALWYFFKNGLRVTCFKSETVWIKHEKERECYRLLKSSHRTHPCIYIHTLPFPPLAVLPILKIKHARGLSSNTGNMKRRWVFSMLAECAEIFANSFRNTIGFIFLKILQVHVLYVCTKRETDWPTLSFWTNLMVKKPGEITRTQRTWHTESYWY